MNRIRIGVAAVALLLAAGCGGSNGSESPDAKVTKPHTLGRVTSVTELRDALIAAGYDCPNWDQTNVVKLAAESGSCDDSSVLSTFASQSDLQTQLDTTRALNEMSAKANVEVDPSLVGPNWIFNAPDADAYASELGGTVLSPPS